MYRTYILKIIKCKLKNYLNGEMEVPMAEDVNYFLTDVQV